MSSPVIEQIERAARLAKLAESARAEQAAREYGQLVESVARGNDADPEQVLAQVAAAGQTVEEFKAAVAFRAARFEAAELLTGLPEAERRVEVAAAAVAKIEADRKATLAKFDAQIAKARGEHNRAAAELEPYRAASAQLEQTAPAELARERIRIIDRRGFCRGRIEELTREAEVARERLAKGVAVVRVEGPGYDPALKHFYSAAERASLTRARFEMVRVEQHAAERAAALTHNELLESAAARSVRPTDVWDRERIVAQERVRAREKIVADHERAARREIEALEAEAAAVRTEVADLERAERDAVARMLVP